MVGLDLDFVSIRDHGKKIKIGIDPAFVVVVPLRTRGNSISIQVISGCGQPKMAAISLSYIGIPGLHISSWFGSGIDLLSHLSYKVPLPLCRLHKKKSLKKVTDQVDTCSYFAYLYIINKK